MPKATQKLLIVRGIATGISRPDDAGDLPAIVVTKILGRIDR
jgi:hypothetical protein